MKEYYDISKVKAYAELEIAGQNLDLDAIARLMGLNITYIKKYGDHRRTIKTGVVIAPAENKNDISIWKYRTAEKGTYDTEIQIEELTRVFRRKTNELKTIKAQYADITIRVNVVVYCRQTLLPLCSVSAEQVRFLAEIGVGLYFDIHHKPKNIIKCRRRPRLLEKKTEGNTDNG